MSDLTLSNISFFEYGSRQVRTAMIDGAIVFGLGDVLKFHHDHSGGGDDFRWFG